MDLRPLAPVFCSMALSATAHRASEENCSSTYNTTNHGRLSHYTCTKATKEHLYT